MTAPGWQQAASSLPARRIGAELVGAVGLGCIQLDDYPDRAEATVRAALDAGVTLMDTAIAYGPDRMGSDAMGENERLLGAILGRLGAKETVLIATKGGMIRTAGGRWDLDSSAAHLRAAVDASLSNLGVEQIGLYQHHRPDPAVPYGEVMTTLKDIYDSGKVRMVGISNADSGQIRQASEILGPALVSVQNEYSPQARSSEAELRLCDDTGLAFLAWSPFGGAGQAALLGRRFPAFQQVGDELGVSPHRVCLAWILAKSARAIPVPGASRPASITDAALAGGLVLSAPQLGRLDQNLLA
jgi:aryl-alcohol dehydrogenase-like predicted oxidoreductase